MICCKKGPGRAHPRRGGSCRYIPNIGFVRPPARLRPALGPDSINAPALFWQHLRAGRLVKADDFLKRMQQHQRRAGHHLDWPTGLMSHALEQHKAFDAEHGL